jgi:hypothetical protein
MNDPFIYRVVLSFFIAGGWIGAATIIAEKLGSRVGGLIANLPSNILIGLLFIAITQDISFVKQAIPGIPVGMLIDTVFLAIFIVALKYGVILSVLASLISWFLLAYLANEFGFNNLAVNVLFYFIFTAGIYYLLKRRMNFPTPTSIKKKYRTSQILIRSVFAGSVVASVIIIAQFSPPYLVGIVAAFPAVLLSTMVILVLNQNKEFAQATGKVLILSSSNIVIYGIAVYFCYPAIGLWWGTLVSFLVATFWVWIIHPVIQKVS